MSVGPIIRALRKEKGVQQDFLARKLAYRHSSGLCQVEKGHYDIKASDIPKLAEALDMDVLEVCRRFFLH